MEGTVTIDAEHILERNYLGIGVQWEPYDKGIPLLETDWQRIFERLDFMRPGIVRLMLNADWYCTGFDEASEPVYDWEAPQMLDLYRELDYLQARGATVIIGEWNSPATTALSGYDIRETDPRWPRLIADFLHQLRHVKGYQVIKYYNLINEPNGEWSHNPSWKTWATAIRNLYETFASRGYLSWLQLTGPDTTDADDWLNAAVDQLQDKLGLYDLHRYAALAAIEDGLLEAQMSALKEYIVQHDPHGADKRFLMAEAGIVEGKIESHDTQSYRYDFIYGVWMADYVVQSIRAGQAGVIAWSLDDAMHTHREGYGALRLKGWGFWNSMGGRHGYPVSDLDLRPWFHTWALLARGFPPGCQTLHCSASGVPGLRVAAAKLPSGGLTVAIVNDTDAAHTLSLSLPLADSPLTLAQYHFFVNDCPLDATSGFPQPKTILYRVDLRAGLTVSLPGRGLVLLTSADA